MNPPDRPLVPSSLTASVDSFASEVSGLTSEVKGLHGTIRQQGRRYRVFLACGAVVLVAVVGAVVALVIAIAALNSQQDERSAQAERTATAALQARDAATAAKQAAESAAATLKIVQEATGPAAQARNASSIGLLLRCQQAYTLNAVRGTAIPDTCPTVTP